MTKTLAFRDQNARRLKMGVVHGTPAPYTLPFSGNHGAAIRLVPRCQLSATAPFQRHYASYIWE